MAKLYIKTLNNPYNISDDDAAEISRLWNDSMLSPSTKFNVGPLSFEKSQIKLIDLETFGVEDAKRYNIDDPGTRQMIKDFEMELNGRRINEYCRDEKLTTKQRSPYDVYGDAIVMGREQLFGEAWKKWSALGELKRRREYANRMELKGKEELIKKMSDEIDVKSIF